MTANDINFANYKLEKEKFGENRRHNIATEKEANRHNSVVENETARLNSQNILMGWANVKIDQDKAQEQARHNLATEYETHRSNVKKEELEHEKIVEQERSNKAREKEQTRSNKAREKETTRANKEKELYQWSSDPLAWMHADNIIAANSETSSTPEIWAGNLGQVLGAGWQLLTGDRGLLSF